MSFVPTPGYTYVKGTPPPKKLPMATQKQYQQVLREWQRTHPTEARLWKQEVRLKGELAAYREHAEREWQQDILQQYPQQTHEVTFTKAEAGLQAHVSLTQTGWKEEVTKQYPRDQYMIVWRDKSALVYPKGQVPGPFSTQKLEQLSFIQKQQRAGLEPEAVSWMKKARANGFLATAVGTPKFKPISRRYGGLAETDIPYNLNAALKEYRSQQSQMFGWKEEHQTVATFEKKYEVLLGLDPGARITHVRRTEAGYGIQYLDPHALDVAVPFGKYTQADIQALKGEHKEFGAWRVARYMSGQWQVAEQTPKQFTKLTGQTLDLPKGSIIVGKRLGPAGYEIQYMSKKGLEAKKLMDQPTLHGQLHETLGGMFTNVEKWTDQLRGEGFVARRKLMEPLTLGGAFRRSERELAFWPVGVVKAGEATVGTIEAILGRPSRRSYIPTATGAIVSTAISTFPAPIGVGGWGASDQFIKAEQESLKKRGGAGILLGEVLFDVGLAVLSGYAIGKAGGLTSRAIKGSRVDVYLAKRSTWYFKKTGGIVAGGVSIPPTAKTMPASFGLLKARQTAAHLLDAPRTYGVWIGKGFVEPTTKHLPHLFYRGGKISIGYLAEAGFRKSAVEIVAEQRHVLPVVTQTQVTRLGIIPYVASHAGPRLTTHTAVKSALAAGVGLGISLKATLRFEPKVKTIPSQIEETLAIQRSALQSVTATTQKQRSRYEFVPKLMRLRQRTKVETFTIVTPTLPRLARKQQSELMPRLMTSPLLVQVQEQKQQLIQRQMLIRIHDKPTVQEHDWPKTFFRPDIPGFALRRKKETLYGAWYYRRHPIAKPRTVVELTGYRGDRKKARSFNRKVRALIG